MNPKCDVVIHLKYLNVPICLMLIIINSNFRMEIFMLNLIAMLFNFILIFVGYPHSLRPLLVLSGKISVTNPPE